MFPIDPSTNRVLLIHRRSSGEWLFPKGPTGIRRSVTCAAAREVGEETGYTVYVNPSHLIAVQVRPLVRHTIPLRLLFLLLPLPHNFSSASDSPGPSPASQSRPYLRSLSPRPRS
ncbi:hypothetical protein BC938DRAFT_475863 [Jimgerdemannia flammicorona]|uniref:Nudix hydrolase domain-containing protein n=1 Tax=Jimgerdemannia flammicorona TaxID=994334 RepID=A0A433PMV5_9FUNG|nr:hypothetical protein BC938DRAFT_475863 [Jimgerdemannia flammicorona]